MRVALVKTKCKRCGKEICTANKSVWGLNALKKKFGSICDGCITPNERKEMLLQMGLGVQRRMIGMCGR
jgi:hypothetical protein